MPAIDSKTLWTVHMPSATAEAQLLEHARRADCSAIAIRTSSDRLPQAIARFHAEGIKVFGWRWPACISGSTIPNYYAPDQARYVAEQLIPAGLDGYFADIESDNDRGYNDWDDSSFANLATEFCQTIANAAPAGFVFALTSGCAQPTGNRHIPWREFGNYSPFVLPQTYWRWRNGAGNLENINGGTPAAAFARARTSWSGKFPGKPLVPIMGELMHVTPAEIAAFGAVLQANGIRDLHAYTDGNGVPDANLLAIAEL